MTIPPKKSFDWHERRRTSIGGSDAPMIMRGEWTELYLLKTGQAEPEDLSDNFQVQLGNVTELFNIGWFYRHPPEPLIQYEVGENEAFTHSMHPFMRCQPDSYALNEENADVVVIDAKHTNAFQSDDDMIERYFWQMVHNGEIMGADHGYLSVIYGNRWGKPIRIDWTMTHVAQLIEKESEFWYHVENEIPPSDVEAVAAPLPMEDMKVRDAGKDNHFAELAESWIRTTVDAGINAEAAKGLKGLVKDDERMVFGRGVVITKDKAGRLSLKEYADASKRTQTELRQQGAEF